VRIPVGALRTALGIVLVGAGLGLATKAGAQIPAPVLAAVPVALIVTIVTQQLMRRSRPPVVQPER
jgi:hypothetical protein